MGVVVGIDLGTTNTVVAAMRDGNPFAILDESGSALIPSIVSFLPSGAVLVGNAAKERRSGDIKNTVYSVKRLIGRPWDSQEVRQARSRFSFELREGPGRATFVMARNETFTLPEISAYVLRKAKSIAEIELGETVDRAVITVPASFNDLQRAATKVAGRVAGLEILRILNEPTAAALAYGYNHGASEKIAVFDFGGGTFDITLLSLTENVFEVLATAGNTFLGGDDLDWAIAEKMADEFLAQHSHDVHQYPSALEQIRAAAENVKIRLSSETNVELTLAVPLEQNQDGLPLSFAMSQAEFERLAAPIVDRAFDVCREALGGARVGIGDIEHVLAVGGCTKIPYVRRRVEEYFKREVDSHLDPHEVVALGAALQAHALTARPSTSRMEVPPVPQPRAVTTEVSAPTTEWRQKTEPFGRLGSTNIGVGPSRPPNAVSNIQVPPPEEALSRPIPTTKHLGSRGRLNTSIGIGPEDTLNPEDLLPVVAGTDKLGGALVDADDDEATAVRASPLPFDDADLPMTLGESKGFTDAQLSEDDTVRVQKNKIDLLLAQSRETQTSPETSSDIDLPAVTDGSARSRSSNAPSSSAKGPSKSPSADELRQRYGDLPLIIGGRRLGTRPPAENLEPGELPVIRAPLDTIVDAGSPVSIDEDSLPVVRGGNASVKYAQDSSIHAELPLVGIGTPEKKPQPQPQPLTQPSIQRPKIPAPTRAAAITAPVLVRPVPAAPVEPVAPAPPVAPSRENRDALPYALSEHDFVEEPLSQPPNTARTSVRPAMRAEPVAEAALPIPNVPSQAPLAGTLGQVSPTYNTAPIRSVPLAANPRVNTAPMPSVSRMEPQRSESRSPITAPQAVALTATQPLANLPGHDLISSPLKSQPQQPRFALGVPLLIDVTPLSLCVETVGSYCDVLIERNTPVPCERSREFVTVQDGQQLVKVRVAQGESRVFFENQLLGEIELTGLRPAARGQLRISVTFGLDSDGILHVRAIDLDTGRAATAELRLAGIPSNADVAHITSRHLATS